MRMTGSRRLLASTQEWPAAGGSLAVEIKIEGRRARPVCLQAGREKGSQGTMGPALSDGQIRVRSMLRRAEARGRFIHQPYAAQRERPRSEERRARSIRPRASRLLRMAGGGSGGDPVARDELLVALGVKAGRFRLGKKLKSVLATYLSGTLELETLEEVESLGAKGFEQALAMACEGVEMPPPLMSGALEWFANLGETLSEDRTAAAAKARTATPKMGVGRAAAAAPRRATSFDPATDDDDDDLESVADFLSSVGVDKQSRDEAIMRLSGDKIQALHRSVYKGKVVSEAEVEGVPYGQDCAHTEWARQLKKTGIVSILKHLESNDYAKAKDHIITLIREYNEKGFLQEVMILTAFVTSAEEMFQGDEKGLCMYWLAYWKFYQGRGFPKEVDLKLVVRSLKLNSGAAALQKNLSTLEDEVKGVKSSMASKVDRSESRISRLENDVKAILARGGNSRNGGNPNRDEDKVAEGAKPCSYCKEIGHFWRNCPARLAQEKKDKEDNKDSES